MKWGLWLFCISLNIFAVFQVSAIHCELGNLTHPGGIFVECDACLAAWLNQTGNIIIQYKGCWGNEYVHTREKPTGECEGRTRVDSNSGPPGPLTICHCTNDLCNVNITWVGNSSSREIPHPTTGDGTKKQRQEHNNMHTIFIVVAIMAILVMVLVFFVVFMKKRANYKPIPEDERKTKELESLVPPKELPPIDLKDILSQGQFCMVRKGRMGQTDVAVKIFPITQGTKPTPSALIEKDIYTACKLSHENILRFIGEHHEKGCQQQLWLVTEYIEQGSLSDFLKRNTITCENLFHMAEGMALGMAYLHVEIPRIKPSIAHRDIKSKNILVKNNLTCCISDFGLSLKFDDRDGPGDTHGQVGTRRYMAPEVLEGAINFSREAFLRIDMYAFALCFWELLTRCTVVQEEPVGDYKLPFEEEVGIHPSLEELQEYVVSKKLRPGFPADWQNKDQAIDGVIVTIEECWDHDADARLTADCVAERIKQLRSTAKRQTNTPLSVSYKSLEHAESSPLA